MRMRQERGRREYCLGVREEQAAGTRARLVAAARRILMTRKGLATFSLEGVAKRAGVSRLTVYNQFGSKVGLLEALYDDLAHRSDLASHLAAAFQQPDAWQGLESLVAVFIRFWHSERTVIRRLRAMAVLDLSFKGATERDGRRIAAMRNAYLRVANEGGYAIADPDGPARILAMLTSFEAFDALASPQADIDWVTRRLQGLVRATVEAALKRDPKPA